MHKGAAIEEECGGEREKKQEEKGTKERRSRIRQLFHNARALKSSKSLV